MESSHHCFGAGRLVAGLVFFLLSAISLAYQCPGYTCDFSDLTPSECGTYTEQVVYVPISPQTATSNGFPLGPGVQRICDTGSGTLTLNASFSAADSIQVGASGTESTNVGVTLKGDIEGLVSPSISADGGSSTTTTWSYSGTGTINYSLSDVQNYGNCQSAHIGAYTTEYSGSFVASKATVGAWEDAEGNCYGGEYCNSTTGSGAADHHFATVYYNAGATPCGAGCGQPQ